MIALVMGLSLAWAAPGRAPAGATLALPPDAQLTARGSLAYLPLRRLGASAELGTTPGLSAVAAGAGPLFEIVDGPWWRVGVVAMPELHVPLIRGSLAPDFAGRGGLRVGWMALWGLSLTARGDWVQPVGGPGWAEVGAGLALRM